MKKCTCGNPAQKFYPHTKEGKLKQGQYIECCLDCFKRIFAGEN